MRRRGKFLDGGVAGQIGLADYGVYELDFREVVTGVFAGSEHAQWWDGR